MIDFRQLFEQIDTDSKNKAIDQIKKIIKGDGTFLKLKKLARKNVDEVPNFLEYVYKKYKTQINNLSKKYNIDYDEIAELFISM